MVSQYKESDTLGLVLAVEVTDAGRVCAISISASGSSTTGAKWGGTVLGRRISGRTSGVGGETVCAREIGTFDSQRATDEDNESGCPRQRFFNGRSSI